MSDSGSSRNNIILTVVLVLNMIAVSFFGLYLFRQHRADEQAKKNQQTSKVDAVSENEKQIPTDAPKEDNSYTRKVVRFESLITNLAGEEGRREVRISLEATCEGDAVLQELNALKPKIRDVIVVAVGSRTAEELASNEGKEDFKFKLREQINSLLSKGKIKEIYITELELN